jgi:hypothetical protein
MGLLVRASPTADNLLARRAAYPIKRREDQQIYSASDSTRV